MERPTETAFALQPKQLAAATGSAKVLELEWFFRNLHSFHTRGVLRPKCPRHGALGPPIELGSYHDAVCSHTSTK